MRSVNMHQAKTHLSRLVEEAAQGTDVIIAKAGNPVARLTAPGRSRKRRKLGWLAGKAVVPPDFDAPLPDQVLASFEQPLSGLAKRRRRANPR